MTIGERIRFFRKQNGYSIEEFASRISVGKSAVSRFETGVNGTTDQTIRSICREFGVNETWLRTGEGEMLKQTPESVLDNLCAEYSLSLDQRAVIEGFLDLDAKDRESVLKYFHKVFDHMSPAVHPIRAEDIPEAAVGSIANAKDVEERYNAELAEEHASGGKEFSTIG